MTPPTRDITQPQGCTNLQLRQLMRRVAQHYDAEMGKAGLKTTQFSLLTAVDKLGPLQPNVLARTLGLQASTLTRNLKPLVAAGFLELGPGSDGRSRRVAITDAGRAKRGEAQRLWKVAQLELNRLLGVERVVALHALIQESLTLLAPVALEEQTDDA
jgi:DNA-binding MarR family transcriptional regulator